MVAEIGLVSHWSYIHRYSACSGEHWLDVHREKMWSMHHPINRGVDRQIKKDRKVKLNYYFSHRNKE